MRPDAEVRLPAETAYVAVLRMTAAGIAARLDFTVEEIEDLRMAVGEACTIVLADATPGGSLTARFFLDASRIRVEIAADAVDPAHPDPEGFGWQVLSATASDVSATVTADQLAITLAVTSSTATTRA